ncbi:MAG: Trk system potassium transporter TrkA [Clostridia bacterium]|jgi:trk system potassium uptake protein TrkA|nr:Trk system potassium transporter TrkA [Clostridia bacterium]
MQIMIVGCGKMGTSLAVQLVSDGHRVTVIDRSESVIEQISNTQDVIGYVGNGAVFSVLEEAGAKDADLLLALTQSDELNLLACLIAHKIGARHTIARVRNPEYANNMYRISEDLGLSMTVNPDRQAAEEIARVLRFPAAMHVELFARGHVELVTSKLPENSVLSGIPLYELPQKLGVKVLICAVERDGVYTIPSGGFELKGGDVLYVTGAPREVAKALRKAGVLAAPIRSVILGGGGRVSYYLAQELLRSNLSVKIIERSKDAARQIAELLPDAAVINGDVTDHDLLQEEGIERADAFIALTGLDEGNVLSALYAKRRGVSKVIAKVNNDGLERLVRETALDSVISPKHVASNVILRYVRAREASADHDEVRGLYKIADGSIEVLEFLAGTEIPSLLNVPLKDLKTKKNVLIACIVRNGKAIIPGGADSIQAGDVVLVVSAQRRVNGLGDILEETK